MHRPQFVSSWRVAAYERAIDRLGRAIAQVVVGNEEPAWLRDEWLRILTELDEAGYCIEPPGPEGSNRA